jgi:hypothetical protein
MHRQQLAGSKIAMRGQKILISLQIKRGAGLRSRQWQRQGERERHEQWYHLAIHIVSLLT